MPHTLSYGSLDAFVAGTKGMTRAQAKRLAEAELATLFAWIEDTPDAQRARRRPPEVERWLDYTGDLKSLLSYLDFGSCSSRGYKLELIQSAWTQWGHNEKPDSDSGSGSPSSAAPKIPPT